jgi:ABC-type multidrug transport system ATPase subunit
MIEINDLTKTYGDKTAVDHLTVTVRPSGSITVARHNSLVPRCRGAM